MATTLHSFSGPDGRLLYGGVIQASDGNFYGTTWKGGASDMGTVFKMDSNGAVTTLHSFAGNDGAYPIGGVIQGSDGNFYGTTVQGGSANKGTVFKISAAGVLTTLHQFTGPKVLRHDLRRRRKQRGYGLPHRFIRSIRGRTFFRRPTIGCGLSGCRFDARE